MGVYLGKNAVKVYGGGIKVKPEEEKTITASTSTIEVTPTTGMTLKKITVNPTPSEAKTITPSISNKIVTPSTGKLLSKVAVKGDSDLIPANIKAGVNIFGVDGELLEKQVTIDGVKVTEELALKTDTIFARGAADIGSLPYRFESGSSVVINNELHILGSTYSDSSEDKKHYKWDGLSWTSVSTLPYAFTQGAAVVFNNEIHILGNYYYNNNERTRHYKWDGLSWTSVSTLPFQFNDDCAVIFNNEIHIFGDKKHYKWDGTSWTSVSTAPYNNYYGSAVVLNEEIHLLGGYYDSCSTSHYKWNGLSWISVSTLPIALKYTNACVLNNNIYIRGNDNDILKWDGITWTVNTTYFQYPYSCMQTYDNAIYCLGGDKFTTAFHLIVLSYYKKVG